MNETTRHHSPTAMVLAAMVLAACARMGSPDGGWYDETPPTVVSAVPADGAVDVSSTKINILFSEYIKIENATEKVVVSPPQKEMPDIESSGKKITVKLNDTLRANTTYTIDFSDAISDNNEGNPLGNYAYTFSTGDIIDTLEVSGYVLAAKNLEPVKGILVGLYPADPDSVKPINQRITTEPPLRVARTDSRGHFVIRGIAPGQYLAAALDDVDADYLFSQRSEMIAYSHDTITPTCRPDIRQDTIWTDSLHIKTITPVGYTHFLPDDIVLQSFNETITDRYFIKHDRTEAERFILYFSYGGEIPEVRGLNYDASALLVEASAKGDTVTYWLRDTLLVNTDTLWTEIRYMATDTLGQLAWQTDTLEILAKQPYARRQRAAARDYEAWRKKEDRKRRRGEPYDTIMPPKELEIETSRDASLDPDRNIMLRFKTPIETIDTSKIHLYSKIDTLWYNAPFEIVSEEELRLINDTAAVPLPHPGRRRYAVRGEWRPGIEYSLEIDSAAFIDVLGKASEKLKRGFTVKTFDSYSTLTVNIVGTRGMPLVVQLLNSSDNMVKEQRTTTTTARFYYVAPGGYYLRLFVDTNGNGVWDTGEAAADTQPEQVYYCNERIYCRAKWDVEHTWNPTERPLYQQKPTAITKQKADKEKQVRQRNIERARSLGIEYNPE